MPDSLLTILKLVFLLLLYLFFFRVLAAVWAEINPRPTVPAPPSGGGRRSGSAPGPAPAPTASGGKGPTRVRVIEPAAAKGQTWDVGDEVTVGRAAGCGVPLTQDTTVSQLHARIFRRDGRLMVEDLGSTNGTFLNGKKVSAPVPLRVRDRLQVGATVLEVSR